MNSATAHAPQIIFIYDGECPICQMGAKFFRTKSAAGELLALDGRSLKAGDALYEALKARQLNLDEGMVIVHGDAFYHGEEALKYMAIISADYGFMNRFFLPLFSRAWLAKLAYPVFKAGRNAALTLKRVNKIGNLN